MTTQHSSHHMQTQEITYLRPVMCSQLSSPHEPELDIVFSSVTYFMPLITGYCNLRKLFCDQTASHSIK